MADGKYIKQGWTLTKAVYELMRQHKKALSLKYVKKPISWALYHTWRILDNEEKERETKDGEES